MFDTLRGGRRMHLYKSAKKAHENTEKRKNGSLPGSLAVLRRSNCSSASITSSMKMKFSRARRRWLFTLCQLWCQWFSFLWRFWDCLPRAMICNRDCWATGRFMPPDAYTLLQKTLKEITNNSTGLKLAMGLVLALWSGAGGEFYHGRTEPLLPRQRFASFLEAAAACHRSYHCSFRPDDYCVDHHSVWWRYRTVRRQSPA